MECSECQKVGLCARCAQEAYDNAEAVPLSAQRIQEITDVATGRCCSECHKTLPALSNESVLSADTDGRIRGQVALNLGWHTFLDGSWICPACALLLDAGRAQEVIDDDRR